MYTCILGHEVVSRWEGGEFNHITYQWSAWRPCAVGRWVEAHGVCGGSPWRHHRVRLCLPLSQVQGCLLHEEDAPSPPWSSSQSCVWGMVIRESVIKTVDRNMRIDSDLAMLCKSMVPGNSTTFCRLWCCVHTLALCTCQSGWIPFSISASDIVDDECRQMANSGGREGCWVSILWGGGEGEAVNWPSNFCNQKSRQIGIILYILYFEPNEMHTTSSNS